MACNFTYMSYLLISNSDVIPTPMSFLVNLSVLGRDDCSTLPLPLFCTSFRDFDFDLVRSCHDDELSKYLMLWTAGICLFYGKYVSVSVCMCCSSQAAEGNDTSEKHHSTALVQYSHGTLILKLLTVSPVLSQRFSHRLC